MHRKEVLPVSATISESLRIAIVGAGIAGSASAHLLRQALGEAAEITVFEKNEQVGGRIQSQMIAGEQIEIGATFAMW
jgi:protoporphyrinogen oxidase